jgi:translation initiation factor IF-1
MTPTRGTSSETDDPVDETGPTVTELEGIVLEALPRALYRVEVGPGDRILAHLSGDPRRNFVRILKGDRVKVRRTALNRTRGRITGLREATLGHPGERGTG